MPAKNVRSDKIEHGSAAHAQMLGLRKATKEDKYVQDGWTLVDFVQYGPAATPEYIAAILVQKVSELNAAPAVPANAPAAWTP